MASLPRLLPRLHQLPRTAPSTLRSLGLRYNSTRPTPPPQPEATTFSSKATPSSKAAHESPEIPRGMPDRQFGPAPRYWRGQPQPAGAMGANAEAFDGPSRPRLVYKRPGTKELPKVKSVVPFVLALGLLGLGWSLFILHATNSERLASSVLRQVTFQLRNSPEVMSVLGDNVKLVQEWWALGSPWISGTINLMQGRVDLSFKITGSRQGAIVYFTSIRPNEAGAWRIVRYKVIADDGEVIRLEEKAVRPEQKVAL